MTFPVTSTTFEEVGPFVEKIRDRVRQNGLVWVSDAKQEAPNQPPHDDKHRRTKENKPMEEQKPDVAAILKSMAEGLGAPARPMEAMARVVPAWIPRQAQERTFLFDLPTIPAKYKQLIMIAVAAASGNKECTTTQIKMAARAGVSKEEIGEAILAARFALGSTLFSTAVEGLESLVDQR